MDCPKCKSSHHVKQGIVGGKQRYKCKDCRYHYTVERKSSVKTPEIRRLALELYLEGLGFRRIGRILKISYGTVYAWSKEWNSQISSLPSRRETPAVTITMEQMLAHMETSKNALSYGLLLIDLESNISFIATCGDKLNRNKINIIN